MTLLRIYKRHDITFRQPKYHYMAKMKDEQGLIVK